MVMEADEPLQQKDAEESRDDPQEDRNDRGLEPTFSMTMHVKGVGQEIEEGDTDHDPRDETQRDLHPPMRQSTPERNETTNQGSGEDEDEREDEVEHGTGMIFHPAHLGL